MNNHNSKIISAFSWIFWILVVLLLLLFVGGECFMPEMDSGLTYRCELFSVQWQRLHQDGRTEAINVPGKCPAEKGEEITIQAVLPDSLNYNSCLCFRSSQQDMEIYIDGVLRTEYTTKHTRLFGKNSISAFVFVEIYPEDAGKEIRVVSLSNSDYTGVFNEIYYGDAFGIWRHFIKLYGVEFITAVLMMILGIGCTFFCVILRWKYKQLFGQEYLGWGMFLTALWIFSESKLRQLFILNTTLVGNITFLVAMILPFPFLIYVNHIQHNRYWKKYAVAMVLSLANCIGCLVQQLTNQRDFYENMPLIYGGLVIGIAVIGITILLDIKGNYIRDYLAVAVGLFGMMIVGIAEMILIYSKILRFSSVPLSIGLVFLMIMASIKTGQDIFKEEKKQEHAVAEGTAKMAFLANMSHEIRTPINTVIGMNEMILRENEDETIQKYAGKVYKAGNMLLALVNEILDFSKLDAGTLKLEKEPYFLASLLNDVIHNISKKTEEKNLEMVLHIDENLPAQLRGDEIRLKQILNHLISNAIKCTKEGSITLTVQGIYTNQGDFWLELSLADTGIGIRKEDLSKLFGSFIRMEHKKNSAVEGMGLGLNITKQLVERMGGEISVESEYGKGSTFSVKVPQEILCQDKIGNLQAAYEKEVIRIRQYQELFQAPQAQILVVDDNRMNLVVVKSLLKKTQIQMELVPDGTEALKLAKQKKYDLILLDHMMPEPDGVEVLHRLREEKDNPNNETPIIVLTANAVSDIREWYMNEGFQDYLSKPIVAEKLEKMVKKYLPNNLIEEVVGEVKDNLTGSPMDEEQSSTNALIDIRAGMTYCMGDEELYYEILTTYYEQGLGYRERLQALYEERKWKDYAVIVHAIKSTSLNIGAKELSQKAKQMELDAKEEKQESIDLQLEAFMDLYTEVLKQIEKLLKENSKEGTVKNPVTEKNIVSKKQYLQECKELLENIRAYEMQNAVDRLEKLKGMYFTEGTAKEEEALVKVLDAVNDFAYDEAEQLLIGWIERNE